MPTPEELKEKLRTLIADTKARPVFIIGTGVSVGATNRAATADWYGLLFDGVKKCRALDNALGDDWEEDANKRIQRDMISLLGVAEEIATRLGYPNGEQYRLWLQDAVGSLKAKNSEVLDALRDLNVPLATTNYDSLLAEATNREPITWLDKPKVERFFQGEDKKFILHLHGHWKNPQSAILGIRSYEEILRHEHQQQYLRTLVTSHQLVFVGYGAGLSDPNFGKLLEWMRQVLSGEQSFHYRLALLKDIPNLQGDRALLEPVNYGSEHKDLPQFLRDLIPAPSPSLVISPPIVAAVATPPEPISVPVPNLPTVPNVVGRDEEVRRTVAALLAEPPRPLPMLGSAGIGKSTVSAKAMRGEEVAQRFGARRYFVRCDGATTAGAVWSEIAKELKVSGSPIEAAVLTELHNGSAALVLDNFETPWDADTLNAENLLKELAAVPSLALIVALRGEQRPFGLNWHEAEDLRPLGSSDARQVFLDVAGDKFGADAHLNELLTALGGVPLALTLLAHRAQGEPNLDGVWKLWQAKRVEILRRPGVGGKDANLATSYEISITDSPRMTDEARRLLSLLALLPDGVAQEDLDAIFPGADGLGGTEAATVLRGVGLAYDEAKRLRLLAPLREYVARQYKPQDDDLTPLHDHYLKLAESCGKEMRKGTADLPRLAIEASNIAAMLTYALDGEQWSRAVDAIWYWADFVRFTGLGSANPIEAALKKCREKEEEKSEADCIFRLGNIALARSEHEEARQRYELALPLYQRVGDVRGEANCIHSLGEIALRRSEHEEARQRYELALPLYQRVGDVQGEANCIQSLGDIALARSEHEEARQRYELALPLYQRVGAALGEANCIQSLGNIALARSEHEEARQRYELALSLYQRVGAALGEANCIKSLGNIALERSEHEEARQRYELALPLYQRVGDVRGEANCIYSLGEIALRRSEHEEARQCCEGALLLYQRVGDVQGEANCIYSLGNIALERSEHEEARQRYELALSLYQRVGAALGEANCIKSLGNIAQSQGNEELARQQYETALALYRRIPEPYSIGWTHFRLAQVTEDETDRLAHACAARRAWRKIGFEHLMPRLENAFPDLDLSQCPKAADDDF